MNLQEQQHLQKISELYQKLGHNVNGEYRAGCLIGKPGFGYDSYARQLLEEVEVLYNNFHPTYLSESDIRDLQHTMSKEVAYVEHCHTASIQPRATQKSKDAVCSAIRKANKQIHLDLHSLFAKMEEG